MTSRKFHPVKFISVLLAGIMFQPLLQAQTRQVVDSLATGEKIIVAGKQYDRSGLHSLFWGRHYRKEWATPVKVQTKNLESLHGGLKPIQEGGGRQTKTLRLEAANGKQYVLRSIDKTFAGALPEIFQNTFIESIANDQVSVAHPYSALTVPSMAEAANVYHTNPSIFYLAPSAALGEYNSKYADQVYLFEERPDGDQSDESNFGRSKDVDGTENLLKVILEENDHRVDQESFVRARLFDMFLSDWGRHEDQWRWAKFEENGLKIYRPIPRDRDQSYTLFDGFLVSFGAASPQVGFLQSFDYTIKDLGKFNYQARYLDRHIANEPPLDTWVNIAKELQASLTDTVIETAVHKLPPEVYPLSGDIIAARLKSRRDHLVEFATNYYNLLSREVDITGTKQRELFEINGATPEETRVNVFRLTSAGEKKELIYTRTFKASETKEVRLYGIDGNDQYVVYGDPGKAIKIRLIGGPAKDKYEDKSPANSNMYMLLYDNSGNEFAGDYKFRLRLSDDSNIHKFNYEAYKANSSGITKGISYSNEDEFYVSLGYKLVTQKWRKEPFASSHYIKGNYSLTQNAFSAQYKSIFTEFIAKLDWILFADWDQERDYHFPGIGNNTVVSSTRKNYYRTRFREFYASSTLQKRFGPYHKLSFGGFYHVVKILRDSGKYVFNDFAPLDRLKYKEHSYAGVKGSYEYAQMNHKLFPSKGIKFTADMAYTIDLHKNNHTFTRFSGLFGFYVPLLKSVVLAVKTQGSTLDGDAEFFDLPRIGGGSTLRGFLRHRFFGKTAFSNQNELQWLINFKSYLFNGKIGLIGIFDNGRVWQPGETSDKWHSGYGGGLMIAPFNKISITGSYTKSVETSRINIRVGRLF